MRPLLAPGRAFALTVIVGIGVLILVLVLNYLASTPSCAPGPPSSSLSSGGSSVCVTFQMIWPFYLFLGSALILIVVGATGFVYHRTRRRKVPVATANH